MFSKVTYYSHQSKYLFPLVLDKWRTVQQEVLQGCADKMTLQGDARSDSPGHCAKYGTYTLMDGDTNKVVDFQLVQVSSNCLFCVELITNIMLTF